MHRALLQAFQSLGSVRAARPDSRHAHARENAVIMDMDASKIERTRPQSDNKTARSDFSSIIDEASRAYGVDKGLIRSVIQAESGFEPRATSPKGAMGLMQLMPETARGLGVRDAYDPGEHHGRDTLPEIAAGPLRWRCPAGAGRLQLGHGQCGAQSRAAAPRKPGSMSPASPTIFARPDHPRTFHARPCGHLAIYTPTPICYSVMRASWQKLCNGG